MTSTSLRRGLGLSILFSVLSIVVLLIITGEGFSVAQMRGMPIWASSVGLALMVTAWSLRAVRLSLLSAALGHRLPFRDALAFYVSGAFVSHVTPASSGGVPFLMWAIYRAGMPLGRVSALLLFDSLFNLTIFLALLPLGPWLRRAGYLAQASPWLVLTVSIAVLLATVLLVLVIARPKQVSAWLGRATSSAVVERLFGHERTKRWTTSLRLELRRLVVAVHWLAAKRWPTMIYAAILAIVYWAAYLAIVPVLILGLEGHVDTFPVMLAQLVFNLLQGFIPTPGSSGGAEILFAYLFSGFVSSRHLAALTVYWRIITFYASLVVGAILLFWVARHVSQTAPHLRRTIKRR